LVRRANERWCLLWNTRRRSGPSDDAVRADSSRWRPVGRRRRSSKRGGAIPSCRCSFAPARDSRREHTGADTPA
jgi:hypothetical protein